MHIGSKIKEEWIKYRLKGTEFALIDKYHKCVNDKDLIKIYFNKSTSMIDVEKKNN